MNPLVSKYALSLMALACMGCAFPASAQEEDEFISPGGVLPAGMVQSLDPADRLAMNLRLLSQNPRDVNALTQAGTSALAVGDPNAAIGFLARAEALSPSNGRVKAGLGSALVMLERPIEAMRFFNEAVAFGIPERDIWKDRGLAFDLSGDPKRAQRDYEQMLRTSQDAEVTKRLALSLGASGEKDQALRLLEPLVRRNDQGAWRARAFVLAMAGDIKGAERIVEQVMPTGSLSPFLRRLASLNVADRARAVNFGTMPSDGTQFASAIPVGTPRAITTAASNALASASPAATQRFESSGEAQPRKSDRVIREKRRRPGRNDQIALAQPQPVIRTPAPASVPAPVNRTATPGFSNDAARPVQVETVERVDRRVGKRIGPVDIERLPDAMKPGAAPTQVTRVAGNVLPPPSGVVPAVIARTAPPVSLPAPVAVVRPPVQVAAALPEPFSSPPVIQGPEPARAVPVPVRLEPTSNPATAPVFEVAAIKPAPPPVNIAPIAPTSVAATQAVPAPTLPTPVVSTPVVPTPVVKAPVVELASKQAFTPPIKAAETVVAPVAAPNAQLLAAVAPPSPLPPVPPSVPDVVPPAAQVAAAASEPEEALTKLPTGSVQTASMPVTASTPGTQAKLSGPTPQEAGISPSFGSATLPASSVLLADISSTTVTPLSGTQLVPAVPNPTAPGSVASVEPTAAALLPQPAELTSAPVGLASVLAGITPEEESRAGPLLSDTEFRRARMAAKRKAEADALAESGTQAKEDAEAKAKREEEEERKRVAAQSPARVWVQVATGANKSGLPITWKRIREQAPDALKGAAAWYTSFRSTNRLLVGPYKGQSDARSLVNKLSAKGLSATTFTSDAGQEIARLSSR
jgi:hypothetical protein